MSKPNPDPDAIDYGISWLRPPFGTIAMLLIPLGYSGYGAEGLQDAVLMVVAFLLGFSPTLLFAHLGKHRFVKQIMAAFAFLPWVLVAHMPEIPSDDTPRPPPELLDVFIRMFLFSFVPGLMLGLVSVGLYFFWKAGFAPEPKRTPDPLPQGNET